MSPTENDLRAALHNGEGDPVDADRIIAGGQARRAQRRARLLGGTAVVAFVAAAATGGALLAGSNNDSGSTGSAGKNADGSVNRAATHAGAGAGGGYSSGSSGVTCPSAPTKHSLGSNANSSGAGGRLFPKPVTSVTLCGYSIGPNIVKGSSSPHGTIVLKGDVAQQLVDSLENAARTRPHVMCPDYRLAVDRTLEVIGVTSNGSTLTPVTVDLSGPACSNTVTNGTAVRYAWSPSTSLSAAIAKSLPGGSGSLNPGGGGAPPAVHHSGSPVK